jgi:hypothetical protein
VQPQHHGGATLHFSCEMNSMKVSIQTS